MSINAEPKVIRVYRVRLKVVSPRTDFGRVEVFDCARAMSITIGSSADCDFRLPISPSTSEHHCTLRLLNGSHIVQNHSPKFPVTVDGKPVSDWLLLRQGACLVIGATALIYELTSTPDENANPRKTQEERGLAALYEHLKRLIRRLGIGKS